MMDEEVLIASPVRSVICCDPYRNVHRWVVLAFCCILAFGSYFCYDNPAALEDKMRSDLSLSGAEYGLFYTVYSWPNVIFPLLGGYLIDRVFGIRLGSILFSGFIMAGQIVFASGAMANAYWLMLLGRVIFSVGGENLAVCQNNYAVRWFKGHELNTVFAIQLSFARVGSAVNMYAMLPLYNWVTGWNSKMAPPMILGWALMIGGLSTIVSFLSSLILGYLDKRNERYQRLKVESESLVAPEPGPTEEIKLSDVKNFPASYWVLCAICVAYYNAIFPLVGFGLVFYESKFRLPPFQADICNSLIYLISIVASPVMGMLVDYFGRNLFWILLATALTIAGHGLLAFTFLTPYVAMVVVGIAYSMLAASLWPSVAYLIPERALGTAYGAMQAIQNLGLGVLFFAAGAIVDSKGYFMLEIFFLAWLCVTLGCGVLLYFTDKAHSGILTMSSEKRKAYMEAELKAQMEDKNE